ncbi:hypothetical protein [uncultured Campylobacter sp.]|uniref:hypothetical protein n=1 Tax=uncultured Campylobacter sp. TaxID=218934 RepID=UPI002623A2F4|nr:hypothetical protein [uncultured Campylobacter sp.]
MQTHLQEKIKELQRKIARKITYFQTGGVRPRGAIDECWIGRVLAYAADEELPTDQNGAPMLPLAQFYLPALPYVPQVLDGVKLLVVFISQDLIGKFDEDMDGPWKIREHKNEKELVIKELANPRSQIKPFPLQPKFAADDTPVWDGGGLEPDVVHEILELKRSVGLYYSDVTAGLEYYNCTKLGGHPPFASPE